MPSFAVRSSEVRRLLLDLGLRGGTDPSGMFPLILIPKGPPPSCVANYLPIYITPGLSKIFEQLVSVRPEKFMERSGVLPTTQFA